MVPYHTIAFSQQKLRAALRRAAGQDPAFTYGFVVHSRRYSDHPTLGLITLHGESLPLNDRLLKALDGAPLWLFGHARITLGSGSAAVGAESSKADPMDRPLSSLSCTSRRSTPTRGHPASGSGRGAGQGRDPGAAAAGPDPRRGRRPGRSSPPLLLDHLEAPAARSFRPCRRPRSPRARSCRASALQLKAPVAGRPGRRPGHRT